MMSGVSLETCWAIKKHWNNKFYYTAASFWLSLYDRYGVLCSPYDFKTTRTSCNFGHIQKDQQAGCFFSSVNWIAVSWSHLDYRFRTPQKILRGTPRLGGNCSDKTVLRCGGVSKGLHTVRRLCFSWRYWWSFTDKLCRLVCSYVTSLHGVTSRMTHVFGFHTILKFNV
jgi:hypothetical protein